MRVDLGQVLEHVDRAIDCHDLATAEQLLGPLIHSPGSLDTAPADERCRALLSWGWLHGAAGRYAPARVALEEAARIADSEHLAPLLAEALREAGLVARYAGDFGEADSLLARAARTSAQHLDTFGFARATFYRATVAHLRAT
jgi:tetratricopeptide (TPR) repeat protein